MVEVKAWLARKARFLPSMAGKMVVDMKDAGLRLLLLSEE